MKWLRVREAASASSAPALLRAQDDLDLDDDTNDNDDDVDVNVQACPTCNGTCIANGDICSTCDGTGMKMKESTRGPYWVYEDDPEVEQMREASRIFSTDVRKRYASRGIAMPDGSYPIPDADALGRAVSSFGHNATAAVKAHIKKRAAALGLTGKLPDDWKESKEAEPFGGKKAPLFGKKKDKKGGGDNADDKDNKNGPPWLKSKEGAALVERLEALEDSMMHNAIVLKTLREAKPISMTPAFSVPTRVKTKDGQEGYAVTLIREGKGNSDDDQWYRAEAIKQMCESGLCEGMQAYGDHPTEEEEENRPERSVKELVGTYHDVKFAESGGKARADAVFVPLTLDEHHPRYGWVVTLAEAAIRSKAPQPICGISLFGLSAGDDCERPDGSFGRMVDLVLPQSGDIVTNAGAGGGFIRQLMESARALRNRSQKELTPMQALQYQRSIREAVKRVREATSDEDRQAALDELDKLEKETIDSAPDTVEKLREAAPTLVAEITQQVKEEEGQTIEQLREQLGKANSTLSQFTDVIQVSDALREAGVTDAVELKKFANDARKLGLSSADDIKDMVETERAYQKSQHDQQMASMREALGGDLDSEVEGAGALRVPVGTTTDGGIERLRESGVPIKVKDAD